MTSKQAPAQQFRHPKRVLHTSTPDTNGQVILLNEPRMSLSLTKPFFLLKKYYHTKKSGLEQCPTSCVTNYYPSMSVTLMQGQHETEQLATAKAFSIVCKNIVFLRLILGNMHNNRVKH